MTRMFMATEAAKLAGTTYANVDHWARIKFIEPSVPANGAGSIRQYSFDDVLALCVVARLREKGVALRCTRNAIKSLRQYMREKPTGEFWDGKWLIGHREWELVSESRETIHLSLYGFEPSDTPIIIVDLSATAYLLNQRMA